MKKRNVPFKLNTSKGIKLFWIVILTPFIILFIMIGLIALGVFGTLPSFDELENPKSNIATEVYSEDGKVIGSYFIQSRYLAEYHELNESLVAALVATEDMRYYNHSGIDFISLARVGVKTLALGRKQGGGSTITQQLAKNLFPRDTARNQSKPVKVAKLVTAKLKIGRASCRERV